MNVILDYAGWLVFVTDAPSVKETVDEAYKNPRLESVNAAFRAVDDSTADEYAENVPYEVIEIPFAELYSYERGGCEYDECHNLSFGTQYRSKKYCDEHAGPFKEEYADVSVIWEGALDSFDTCQTAEKIRKLVNGTIDDVILARKEGRLDEELGVEVSVSYHTHEFDTREDYDKWSDLGECWCESWDVPYDSHKDEPGENGRPECEHTKVNARAGNNITCADCGAWGLIAK